MIKSLLNNLRSLSTGHKLTAGFSIVLILIGIVGFVGHQSLKTVTSTSTIDNHISSLALSTKALRKAEKNYMIRNEDIYLSRIDSITTDMKSRINRVTQLLPEDSAEVLRSVEGTLDKYERDFDEWLKIHRQQEGEARKMVAAGSTFVDRCEILRQDQRSELTRLDRIYLEESNDKIWKAEAAGELIEMVQKLRIEEKNYTLREDSTYINQNIKTLDSILAVVDSLRNAHDQIENRQQTASIRQAALNYREAFRTWYKYNRQQERQRLVMNSELDIAQKAAEQIERQLYDRLLQSLSNDEELGIEKEYHRVQSIMSGLKALDIHQKRFIMSDDDSLIARNERALDSLSGFSDKLGKSYSLHFLADKVEILREAMRNYSVAFDKFQVAHEGLMATSQSMVYAGRHFRREVQRYRKDQRRELEQIRRRIERETDDKLWKADAANRLIRFALETRSQEKNMMMRGEEKYMKQNDSTMAKIYGLSRELKDRFEQEENDRLAQSIIEAAKKYKSAFDNWARINEQKLDIESRMIDHAREAADKLNRFENRQDLKMDQTIQKADIAIIGGSTLAIFIGLGLAFFLTVNISKSQKKIERNLNEKEILLKEIHHRVKNNLAAISGMLEMQMMDADNEEVEDLLEDSLLRINSIASVHKLLYESESMDRVNLKEYIQKMSDNISGAIRSGKDITEKYNTEDVQLNINQTIPCCLIVNELMTNAYKHAFKGLNDGTIEVGLREDNGIVEVKVSDDGRGLPDDIDLAAGDSLGLKLISSLVKQLQGDFEMHSDNGATFTLSFEKEEVEREISEIKS